MSLRNDLIRLAYSKPDVRKNVLPLVRTSARRQRIMDKMVDPHPKERREWLAGKSPLRVTLFQYGNTFDVTVWGEDDIGLEIENLDWESAKNLYDKVVNRMPWSAYKSLGFESA